MFLPLSLMKTLNEMGSYLDLPKTLAYFDQDSPYLDGVFLRCENHLGRNKFSLRQYFQFLGVGKGESQKLKKRILPVFSPRIWVILVWEMGRMKPGSPQNNEVFGKGLRPSPPDCCTSSHFAERQKYFIDGLNNLRREEYYY